MNKLTVDLSAKKRVEASLSGPVGPRGPRGPKGDRGQEGPAGPKGETGLTQEEKEYLFQSVSNGKTAIAKAITDRGVKTSAEDAFATMADNIKKLPSGYKLKPIGILANRLYYELNTFAPNEKRKVSMYHSTLYLRDRYTGEIYRYIPNVANNYRDEEPKGMAYCLVKDTWQKAGRYTSAPFMTNFPWDSPYIRRDWGGSNQTTDYWTEDSRWGGIASLDAVNDDLVEVVGFEAGFTTSGREYNGRYKITVQLGKVPEGTEKYKLNEPFEVVKEIVFDDVLEYYNGYGEKFTNLSWYAEGFTAPKTLEEFNDREKYLEADRIKEEQLKEMYKNNK